MPETAFELELRPATLEDAPLVADLETARRPDEPADPVLTRYWWTFTDEHEKNMRELALRDGAAIAFVSAWHHPWEAQKTRFGTMRVILHSDVFDERRYQGLVQIAERWLRGEGAKTAIARTGEEFQHEIRALERIGYQEERRLRTSELDLVAQRNAITQGLELCRRRMRELGVELVTVRDDHDPGKFRKLYAMMVEAEQDIPTTAPWRVLSYEEWKPFWFDRPGISEDRFWIARRNGAIVGMSTLEFPVVRGVPYTALTATARAARGLGVARALKYESMNQAIELGFTRVRTSNDAHNAPILRLNEEMGYRLVQPVVELHKDIA